MRIQQTPYYVLKKKRQTKEWALLLRNRFHRVSQTPARLSPIDTLTEACGAGNTAYLSGTLQAGSDSATYHAGGTKLFLPLVMRSAMP